MTNSELNEPVEDPGEQPDAMPTSASPTWRLGRLRPWQQRQFAEALRQTQSPHTRLVLDSVAKILANGPAAELGRKIAMSGPAADLGKQFSAQVTGQFGDVIRAAGLYNSGVAASAAHAAGMRGYLRTLHQPRAIRGLFASAVDLSGVLPNYQKLLANILPKINLPDFAELFRAYQPANWHSAIDEDVHTIDLLDLARDGLPTTWVPGPVVLRALALAAEDQRQQILLDHEEQALDDCTDALAVVVGGPHDAQARLLEQAIGAMRASLPAGAQAIAANVLDTVLRATTSPWSGYKNWLRQHPDDDEFTIGQLRYVATMAPVRPALEEFWPQKGDPIPVLFNRHATSHAAGDIQYNDVNALIGVLLATSIVREFHEQHLEISDDANAEGDVPTEP